MKKTKRNYVVIALVIILLTLAIGYAAFSDTLTISGTANAKGTFDMSFESASIDLDTAKGIDKTNSSAKVNASDSNKLDVVIKDLAYPGAGASVTAVIKNNGTVDAKLTGLNFTGNNDTDIEISYPTDLVEGEIVPAKGTCTVTFTVKWKTNSTLTTEKSLDFSAVLEYEQSTIEFTGTPAHN